MLKNTLSRLAGCKIISATTGGGAGSILKIELETDCFLMIYCSWRIEHDDIVLATSTDDSQALVGRMASAAKQLESLQIVSLSVSKQFDLTINFDSEYCLRCFCDISYSQTEEGGTYDCNWILCIPEKDICYEFNNYFKLNIIKYY